MLKNSLKIVLLVFLTLYFNSIKACQCPLTELGMKECNKYEVIFKGKIISVKDCNHNFGEAIFEIQELYKGDATKQFKVLFECNVDCAQKFSPGDEWIIYSNYKQIENAKMDWCSRSRKFFKIENEDFYTFTYGNDYYDEAKFLKEKLGLHRFLNAPESVSANRNILPNQNQAIVIIICSILGIVLFYWLFNKFFK